MVLFIITIENFSKGAKKKKHESLLGKLKFKNSVTKTVDNFPLQKCHKDYDKF